MEATTPGENVEGRRGVIDVPPPPNVTLGANSRIIADEVTQRGVFSRFRSSRPAALLVGENTLVDGVAFNVDVNGEVKIGRDCHLVECYLIATDQIRIGDNVAIGWHATIVDSDFHPVAPVERSADVQALSPLAKNVVRQPGVSKPVVIGNGVWIGPLAVVLKGVHIGEGARIEPGAVISRDVPPGVTMLGNPARAL